jgi:FdhE protein
VSAPPEWPGRLERLARERPEAGPWLVPLGRALAEAARPAWDAAVPAHVEPPEAAAPLLAGAVLRVDPGAARRWLGETLGAVSAAPGSAPPDPHAVLEAAITHDVPQLERMAGELGTEPAAFRALADLAALPLLLACGRRWSGRVAPAWRAGYCPVCGAWPALAEARGVERSRRFRCGRCGGDWAADWLCCPYCGTRDHARLGALVPATAGERRRVETCNVCRGYLKTLTTLAGTPGGDVLLEDLASVDLDLAALGEGYRRPDGLGYPLSVTIAARPGLARRLLGIGG